MQDLTSLNTLYAEYRQGDLSKRDLEGRMFEIILEHIRHFHLIEKSEEESADYLCWLYPRLSRAIQKYQNTGATFSTYIGALIRVSLKEYRNRQVTHYITEYAAWTARAADLEVHSPGVEYQGREEDEKWREKSFQPDLLPLLKSRQVLLLILKSYYFISEDFLDRIAPFTGVEKEKLMEMIEKLRVRRSRREEYVRLFQERITTQFYRCITGEKRLKTLVPGTSWYQKVQIQLDHSRKRLAGMRKRMAGLRMEATHRQIADVLGISAGTVSSSLYLLKSRWGMDEKGKPFKKNKKSVQ
jgi:DNA-directed RNA polymerase specialized sigma subunit